MAFEINKEEKTVLVKKDCTTCEHFKVCKFHKSIKDVTKTDEFYGIVQYAEWNNALRAFELYSRCSHFKYKYPIGSGVTLDSDPEIIRAVLSNSGSRSWLSDFKNKNQCTITTDTGEQKDVKVSDVLSNSGYTISEKIIFADL